LLFQKLAQRFPKERRIYDAVVEINRRNLNFEGAARTRQQQQIIFPEDASIAWERAELLEQAKQFAQARSVYDSLASAHPGDPEPALASAATYTYADSLASAADAYRTVVAAFPDRVEPLHALADVVMERAQTEEAAWRDVLDTHRKLATVARGGKRATALGGVGKAYEALGRPDSARSAYQAALDADDENTWAHYRLAAMGATAPDYTTRAASLSHAEKALRQVLRQAEDTQSQMLGTLRETGLPRPGDRDIYRKARATSDLAGEIFTFFGDRFPLEQTEPVILDVLDTYDASGRLLYLTGRYYDAHDREADALRFYERATREAPDLRDAHLALGRHHADAGRTRAAMLSYERALGADERHPQAYRALIGLYREQGQLDVLVRRWQSRLRATPTNDVLRKHLVDALHRLGRHEKARSIARGDSG
jgi:tetratricopeptide (TPR) repeat protein